MSHAGDATKNRTLPKSNLAASNTFAVIAAKVEAHQTDRTKRAPASFGTPVLTLNNLGGKTRERINMWVYEKTEDYLWTVGHYSPNGEWHTDSDHPTPEEAADRCACLNGDAITRISGIKDLDKKIEAINSLKKDLHEISPFKTEPVDCVLWVKADSVVANDYNPNSVAPPEMKLLETSIKNDGYTQPIVSWEKGDAFEVVDGFHRNRVGKEVSDINERIHNYLPLAVINANRTDKSDRIASTIRHNRARGKHQVSAMSDIVLELKNRNWTTKRICKQLGMDEDEVLRLCQISGLSDIFQDEDFSKSWDIKDSDLTAEEQDQLIGNVTEKDKEENGFRTVNTNDENRIFHKWDKWECYKAGFFESSKKGVTKDQGEEIYREFLSDLDRFGEALNSVINEWTYSCEHYLTNEAMNRIAWLGQASICYAEGLPAAYRGGYNLLTDEEKQAANELALEYLNKWPVNNDREPVSLEEGMPSRQSTIY